MESYIRAGILSTFLVQMTPLVVLLFMLQERNYWLFVLFLEALVSPIALLFWHHERCNAVAFNAQWVVATALGTMAFAMFMYGIVCYKYEREETLSKSGNRMDAFLLVILSALAKLVQFIWPASHVLCERDTAPPTSKNTQAAAWYATETNYF